MKNRPKYCICEHYHVNDGPCTQCMCDGLTRPPDDIWAGGVRLRDIFAGLHMMGQVAYHGYFYAEKAYDGADEMLGERARK